MKDFEERYPLAIVAFGSARLTKEDRYYVLARSVGEGLARRGYLVRTGAGPGIMDAVPVGWKREVSRSSSLLSLEHTQGVRWEMLLCPV
jgi:predicted Rossmann-fold nucleotide-binding protein